MSRHDIGHRLARRGLLGTAVEVGSAHGTHAMELLDQWPGKRLFLVDPWTAQDPTVYRERQEPESTYQGWFHQCLELGKKTDGRICVLRGYSTEVAPLFANRSLDFVYIDANHSFEEVTKDLEAWYPKVKLGGILGGHDYWNNTTTGGHYCEVEGAVSAWAKLAKLEVTVLPDTSWLVDVPLVNL
jgi:hypothetical protein